MRFRMSRTLRVEDDLVARGWGGLPHRAGQEFTAALTVEPNIMFPHHTARIYAILGEA